MESSEISKVDDKIVIDRLHLISIVCSYIVALTFRAAALTVAWNVVIVKLSEDLNYIKPLSAMLLLLMVDVIMKFKAKIL